MKRKNLLSRLFLYGCLVFFAWESTAQAQNIHLITVGDYRGFKEQALEGIKRDIHNIQTFFEQNVPADHLRIINIDENNATPRKVVDSLKTLTPAPEDVVVFYYSGHAVNMGRDGGHCFQLLDENGKDMSFLPRKDIKMLLCQSKPKMAVLLTDCCNNIPKNRQKDISKGESKGQEVFQVTEFSPVIKKLFLEQTGILDMTSSKFPDFSYATEDGSIATLAWIETFLQINEELKKDPSVNKSWRDVIKEIAITSDKIFCEKYPDGSHEGQKTQIPHVYDYPGLPRFGVRVLSAYDNGSEVEVTEIVPDSPGAKAGIKMKDIIQTINGQEIHNEADYSHAIDIAPTKSTLTVKRGDETQTIEAELEGSPFPEPNPETVQ